MKIFIFGTGTIAEVAYSYLKNSKDFHIHGFVEFEKHLKSKKKFGLPIIKFENIEESLPSSDFKGFIAIGYKNFNKEREHAFKLLKDKNYELISFVHENSTIAKNVEIGENCMILENQTIQTYVKIGNNVTLWSGNHIGHHSEILENTFISSHVVISGGCKIGKNCFFGVNSSVADGIKINDFCSIFMNTSVSKNLDIRSIVVSKNSEIIIEDDKKNKVITNKFYK